MTNNETAARTTNTYDSQAGTNHVWANCTSAESNGMLIEPALPRTFSWSPRKASNPARVMTKLGIPMRLNTAAYTRPITTPAATAAAMAIHTGTSRLTNRTARIAADSPLTDPTDRSISPTSSTHTMPSAITPTGTASITRLTRLGLDRKIELEICRTVEMTTSPAMTGSRPRSPPRTRSMKPRTAPRTPDGRERICSCTSLAAADVVGGRVRRQLDHGSASAVFRHRRRTSARRPRPHGG